MTASSPGAPRPVVLDTTVVSELMRAAPDEHVKDWVREVPPAMVYTILSFHAEAAGHYADVVVERDHAGAPIAGFDAQIAAICRSHRAALATRNIDDFSGLGLDLIDPWLTHT